jgi:hypothetical protein
MNEAEPDLAIDRSQKAVPFLQHLAKRTNPVNKIFAAFSIVMDMYLDVSDSCVSHLRECVEQLRMILLHGIKEGIARWSACMIPAHAGGDFRPTFSPRLHSPAGSFVIGVAPVWLEMIGDGEPNMLEPRRISGERAMRAIGQIRPKPNFGMAGQFHC